MADPITWGLEIINGKKTDKVQTTLDGLLDDINKDFDGFIDEATEVIEKLGTGLPPRDLAAFSSESTEDGIKLTFTPPGATYLPEHTASDGKQFACMPAGVLIRYSDTGYPRTPDEGKFGYDYKPTGDWVTTSQECTIVGLTKDTKYYFTAFPYSTEHIYNQNQVAANRTEMTWVGNKGTISVTVNTPEGYEGTLGEYTITLVDQASDSPQNVEKTATGAGLTQFGGLVAGKSYKVRLSSTSDLQAPPDSEAITIVGGVNYDVTMTYALMYGTITVNVSTQPAGMPIGQYTVTLTPNDSTEALTQQGNNSQAVVFSNVKNGVVYTVGLSAINHYTANANGSVTAVGGQNISHNAQYGYNATLSEASWNEIDLLGSKGVADDYFSLGDTKNITVDDETLEVELIGFKHDDLASGGGKAAMTFATKNLMAQTSTYDSYWWQYPETKVYNLVSVQIPESIDDGLKPYLKEVKKSYLKSTQSNIGTSALDYYNAKVFCFSAKELAGTGYRPDTYQGTQYSYYNSNSRRVKKLANGTGEAHAYWTTTFHGVDQDLKEWQIIQADGSLKRIELNNVSNGICFGFCV